MIINIVMAIATATSASTPDIMQAVIVSLEALTISDVEFIFK
jgi:hypothetical protein